MLGSTAWLPLSALPSLPSSVALYLAIRLRFGYGFESCDAKGPRNVKNKRNKGPFFPPLLPAGSQTRAISRCNSRHNETCDSCAQGALGSRAAKRGCFKRGGLPDLDSSFLFCPSLSFFVLFGTFPIFPGFSRFARGRSGDFPDSSLFSFSAY